MAYTNITKLTEVTPLNLSFDNLTTIQGATTTLKDTTSNAVGNFWFEVAIVVIFGMLVWWFYRPDKTFALDMTRAVLFSSSWSLFISIAFLLSGWITTVYPVIWTSTIFTICVIATMKLKAKGF